MELDDVQDNSNPENVNKAHSPPKTKTPKASVLRAPRPVQVKRGSSASGGKATETCEERYEWLRDIKDASGVREGEPGYDPSTLLMPKGKWQVQTANFAPIPFHVLTTNQRFLRGFLRE